MKYKKGILFRDIKWGYSLVIEIDRETEDIDRLIKIFENYIRKHEKPDYEYSGLNFMMTDIVIIKR